MQDLKNEIVQHLKSKYTPKCIIMHGSRVNGNNRPQSDWDFLVLGATGGRTELLKGQSLDVETLEYYPASKDFIKTHGPILRRNEILYDVDGSGAQFVSEVEAVLSLGRSLSEVEFENRFLRMSRVLDKLSGAIGFPELFLIHAGVFADLALRFWFEMKGRWSEPPYLGLPILRSEDVKYFALISKLSSGDSERDRCKAAVQIFAHLYPVRFKEHPNLDLWESFLN